MNLLKIATAATLLGATVSAQTLIIPTSVDAVTEGTSSQSLPFNRDSATAASNDIRFQICYDDSNFATLPGPVLINQLRFRANGSTTAATNGGSHTNGTVTVGTAAMDYTAFSTTFDNNWLGGSPPPVSYAGPLTQDPVQAPGSPGNWYITIPISPPVLYDPAAGDLVIEIVHDGVWSATSSDAWATDAQSTGSLGCRMYNSTDHTAATGSGPFTTSINVCEIGYTPPAGIFASFDSSHAEVAPGDIVTFTNTSFTSDPGGFTLIEWDLDNDGVFEATGPSASASFSTCGPNNVSLRVTDATNGSDTATEVGTSVVAPVASFTVAGASPAPAVVNFTDTSTFGPTSWDWDLDGDGVFGDSTVQNPVWAYANPGVVTVTLRATNACGTTEATAEIDTRSLLCTTFAGGNGLGATAGAGNMFDLDVLNPAGVTINGFAGNWDSTSSPGITSDIYIVPGTYVGNELNAAAWTLVASGTGVGAGAGNESVIDIDPFFLSQGTYGVLIYSTATAGGLDYTTGNGTNEVYGNADMTLTAGNGMGALFSGTINSIRVWNGCLSYRPGMSAASTTGLGGGCANSSGGVALHTAEGLSMPVFGGPLTLEVSGAPVSQALSVLFIGFSNIGGVDLAPIGAPGCLLFPSVVASPSIPTDANGDASLTLNLGALPAGVSFYTQAAIADPGQNGLGVILSDALESTVGN